MPSLRPSIVTMIVATLLGLPLRAAATEGSAMDPLASWNDGPTKRAIVTFVARVTGPGSPDFVPEADRIATIDNDGTLWQEKPTVQGAFTLDRLRLMVAQDPSLMARDAVRGAVTDGLRYFETADSEALMEILSLTHAGMTDEAFDADARSFFATARHPKLDKPYTELTYRPMIELLAYLRANGFTTYICSGGGVDFMRIVSDRIYGIPVEQVIGSNIAKEFRTEDGRSMLWRLPRILTVNDKGEKPVSIDLHIGKRPVFAAGNEGGEGDIEMLSYSQGRRGPSFQLLVNHDDAVREFAYSEPSGASLAAAAANGWTVISIKNDWRVVF